MFYSSPTYVKKNYKFSFKRDIDGNITVTHEKQSTEEEQEVKSIEKESRLAPI